MSAESTTTAIHRRQVLFLPLFPSYVIYHYQTLIDLLVKKVDLLDFVDWRGIECLNQNTSHSAENALKQVFWFVWSLWILLFTIEICFISAVCVMSLDQLCWVCRVIGRMRVCTLRATLMSSFCFIFLLPKSSSFTLFSSKALTKKVGHLMLFCFTVFIVFNVVLYPDNL